MFNKIGLLKIFCKIHRKTPVLESLFNKVTGLYPATLLKENTPIQVLSDEFSEIFKTSFFNKTSPGDCFCSTEKYFTNIKKPSETAGKKKNNDTRRKRTYANKYLPQVFISFLLFKSFFILLLPLSHDTLTARVF